MKSKYEYKIIAVSQYVEHITSDSLMKQVFPVLIDGWEIVWVAGCNIIFRKKRSFLKRFL